MKFVRHTLFSSAKFFARGLAKMRSAAEGAALGLENFGSGGVTGSLTSSFMGGVETDDPLSAAAPASDAEGV